MWNRSCISHFVILQCVVSPVSFDVYVDDLIKRLKAQNCSLWNLNSCSLFYADYIVLLSGCPNFRTAKLMLNLCNAELLFLLVKNASCDICQSL